MSRGATSRVRGYIRQRLARFPTFSHFWKAADAGLGKARVVAIAALVGLASAIAPEAASAQLMTLPGKFDVAASGAATYTIAISTPPGTAGMVPSLSLEYNSQSGNGLLGVGWSLAGIVSLGRCPQTIAQDGVHGAVTFTATDRFCLDGQRLIAISGTYGADGAEYRTEVDGYTRVISHGTAGTGPAWFEVHTKSGHIMEFGHTADSQALVQGSATARTWALDKVSDTKGNYYTISYTNDTANGQTYPIEIDYTGNAVAGLAPYNKVQFVYATRPDISPGYQAGTQLQTTVRLTDIKTYAGTALVGDYSLAYQQGAASQRSELTSVTLCAADGSCLPATTFTWQGQYSFPGTTGFAPSWIGDQITTGDFNGDGTADFIACPTTTGAVCSIYYSTPSGLVPSTFAPGWGGASVFAADFNGDGLADLFMCPASGYCALYYSTGTSFVSANFGPGWDTNQYQVLVADFNGDGRADIFACLRAANAACSIWYSTGTGFSQSAFAPTWGAYNVIAADFNGDGMADLFACSVGNYRPCVTYYSTGTSFVSAGFSPGWGGYALAAADFNGDGNTDLFACPPVVADGPQNCTIVYSTGTGFTQGSFSPAWWGFQLFALDFNGDGRADLVACAPASACHGYVSTGTNFAATSFEPNWGGNQVVIGDWVGSGAASVMVNNGPAGAFQQYITSFTPELIATINNSLATTTVTYSPLTYAGVYSRDSTSVYPLQDVKTPMYVVSRLDTQNGIGGTYSSTYTYAGAKLDVSGRGFLGFRQMTVTDLQTGVVHTTNYRQDFPFLGLTASETKMLAAQALNLSTSTFQFSNVSGGATLSSPTNTSAPYRVSVAQTVASSFDLDGSVIPPVTTTFQYDAYGNATQVVTSTPDGYSKTTTSTYSNDVTNWLLGRLLTASVTSQVPSTSGGGQSPPDLTITKSHAGHFVQGQAGTYTITAANGGGTPTSGTVTVVDTLPAGLTATTMSGAGWSCTLSTLTCTRSDALAAGAAYPAITLTVNVASNAASPVTNVATIGRAHV